MFWAFQGDRKLGKLCIYPRLTEIAFHDISDAEMKCYLNKSNTFYIHKPAENIAKCMSHTKCVKLGRYDFLTLPS